MYVYSSTAGATAGRLEQVVGDFNSTPNSPMVDFITSSFLNYSKMSATEIAGYDHRKGQSRVIPSPLLPPGMNIGPNCMYMESETDTTTTNATHSSNGIAKAAGGGTTKNDVLSKNERRRQSSNLSSSHQEERSGQERVVAATSAASGAGDFVQSQNESFKPISRSEVQRSSKRYSKTQSARGAKARGMSYSGIKMNDFPTLAGAKSLKASSPPSDGQSVPSSSELHLPNDTKAPNSDVSTEDSDMEWERESNHENQKSNTANDASSKERKVESHSNCAGVHGQLSCSEPRKQPHCHIQGLITHPFKFITAYPQSRISTPSTVTTFHQSTFETVNYIFFTPPTKKRAGFHLLSRKALPSTHVLLDLGPQLHRYLSSDHLLLQACFQLVSNRSGSRTT